MSLLLGYAFWSIISQSLAVTISLPVSLSFYDVPQKITLTAPEMVTITLRGKRAALNHLDCHSLAFHIDGKRLQEGKNYIPLKAEQLFLPDTINLLDYDPSPLVIQADCQKDQTVEIQKAV